MTSPALAGRNPPDSAGYPRPVRDEVPAFAATRAAGRARGHFFERLRTGCDSIDNLAVRDTAAVAGNLFSFHVPSLLFS